jgi:hypothetical protein
MQAWVGELCGQLIACGLKQTNDSGQLTLVGSGATTVASWTSAALPTATGVANSVAYICFTYNDTLAQGSLSTTALRSGGTLYTSGSYTALVVTGTISGATSARASCTVSGGVAGNLTITTAGSGYIVGEQLTVTGIGSGTLANWTATALSSGSPIIFRLDFGGGSATTDAQMWINLGAGTNGSGTIAGTAVTSKMTQVACFSGAAASSLITLFTSNYCVNMTYASVSCLEKLNAVTTNALIGGFMIFRSNDGNGNLTGTSVGMIANSTTTTGTGTASAVNAVQYMTWNGSGVGSTVYGLSVNYSTVQITIFSLTSTLENATAFVFPLFTINPALAFSAYVGNVYINDVPVGNTFSCAIIGSTALTFLNFGTGFGAGAAIGTGGNNANAGSCVIFQ